MEDFGSVLIAGTGPTAVQLALLFTRLEHQVGIAGRPSARSAEFFDRLQASAGQIEVEVHNEQHRALAGTGRLSFWYTDYAHVRGRWDTLVLTVTADAYLPVLRSLPPSVHTSLRRIVLLSPTLGSSALVRSYTRDWPATPEVISLSSYLGDTRWSQGTIGERVLTAGVKRRVYAGSSAGSSSSLQVLSKLHAGVGVELEAVEHPLAAETRNMSLYVHSSLFMNEFALRAVFDPAATKSYVYKLYPEGPITPELIRTMLAHWRELSAITERLGGAPVNLLDFMLGDGYPVRPESINPVDAARFESLSSIEQEYLLYVRYASLLIDPYSTPDDQGRYFDFSAIAFRPIFRTQAGVWDIPRMPKEDYYRTKIIQGLARQLQVPCPTIDALLNTYERYLTESTEALAPEPCSEAFTVQDFSDDVQLICAATVGVK